MKFPPFQIQLCVKLKDDGEVSPLISPTRFTHGLKLELLKLPLTNLPCNHNELNITPTS